MSAAEVEKPATAGTDSSADDTAQEVQTPKKKGEKTKKTKAKATKDKPAGTKKQKKSVSDLHPKYSQMIHESIAALKDRNGSSRQAILKYIMKNYNVLPDEKLVNNHIKMSLRAGVKSGKLKQCKGSGACGSYKLGDSEKPKKSKSTKAKSPAKKANLTKVKKPKAAASKKAKSPTKKGASTKSPKKASPAKAKSPAKKATKAKKSPKKTKAKKPAKSPKKSKKSAESKPETDSPAADASN